MNIKLCNQSWIQNLYLLYIRISGAQIVDGGTRISFTFSYSDSFHLRLSSVHSWTLNYLSDQFLKGSTYFDWNIIIVAVMFALRWQRRWYTDTILQLFLQAVIDKRNFIFIEIKYFLWLLCCKFEVSCQLVRRKSLVFSLVCRERLDSVEEERYL